MADLTDNLLRSWCFDMAVSYGEKIQIKLTPEDLEAIKEKTGYALELEPVVLGEQTGV